MTDIATNTRSLPSLGSTVWFVFHGDVYSGPVVRVEPPGKPMAYACVWVRMGKGLTCLHGANPASSGDSDHWYATAAQAQAIVDAEKEQLRRVADSHRYDGLT